MPFFSWGLALLHWSKPSTFSEVMNKLESLSTPLGASHLEKLGGELGQRNWARKLGQPILLGKPGQLGRELGQGTGPGNWARELGQETGLGNRANRDNWANSAGIRGQLGPLGQLSRELGQELGHAGQLEPGQFPAHFPGPVSWPGSLAQFLAQFRLAQFPAQLAQLSRLGQFPAQLAQLAQFPGPVSWLGPVGPVLWPSSPPNFSRWLAPKGCSSAPICS